MHLFKILKISCLNGRFLFFQNITDQDKTDEEKDVHVKGQNVGSDQQPTINTKHGKKYGKENDKSADDFYKENSSKGNSHSKNNVGNEKNEKSCFQKNDEATHDDIKFDNKNSKTSVKEEKNVICISDDPERELTESVSCPAVDDDDVISLEDADISILDSLKDKINTKQNVSQSTIKTSDLELSKTDNKSEIVSGNDNLGEQSRKRKSSEMSGDLKMSRKKRRSSDNESISQKIKSDSRKVELDSAGEITASVKRNVIISKNTLKVVKTVPEVSSTQCAAPKLTLQERLGNKVYDSITSITESHTSSKVSPDSTGRSNTSTKSRKVSVDSTSNFTTISSTSKLVSGKVLEELSISKSTSSSTTSSKTGLCSSVVPKRLSEECTSVKSVETKTVFNKPPGEIRTISIKPSGYKKAASNIQACSSKPSTSSSTKNKSSDIPDIPKLSSTKSTIKESLHRPESSSQTSTDQGNLSRNQMELLELEMRARAIKSMLAAHEKNEMHNKKK